MEDSQFSEQEMFAFQFLTHSSPYEMAMLKGKLDNRDVGIICWKDGAAFRPVGIALTEDMIRNITIEGFGKFVKTDENE